MCGSHPKLAYNPALASCASELVRIDTYAIPMSSAEVLTGVLVLITAYYAWQNRRMAVEMAAARKIVVLPKISLSWKYLGPNVAVPAISNVGPGPALDVAVQMTYVPIEGSAEVPIVRRWTSNLIIPGEASEFLTPDGANGGMMNVGELADRFREIRLSGSCSDALGEGHEVEDVLTDIAEWRAVIGESMPRWENPDAEKRLAKVLAEELARKFGPILKRLERRE